MASPPPPTSLNNTQQQARHPYYDEKAAERENRIRSLFDSLDSNGNGYLDAAAILRGFHKLTHLPAHTRYATDLLAKCDTARDGAIDYSEFRTYVLEKEKELWDLFSEIDQSGDNRLRADDLENALKAAGIRVTKDELDEFIQVIDTEGNGYIDFQDWRDFLLLLPQETTISEIYQYYQTSTQLTQDAEVSFSHTDEAAQNAYKYLAAGGIAGAVSRTCTAPFDRLKVYLITQTSPRPIQNIASSVKGGPASSTAAAESSSSIVGAVRKIYGQGGFRGFFVGNGLNVMKIIPESAIKFYVFETAKTLLAQFTGVEDKNAIPVGARFVAGGMAGLCSQFCIYPVETLKTRIMSTKVGDQAKNPVLSAGSGVAPNGRSFVVNTAINMYKAQGIRAFWPGLTLGLLGVFPYQALDMGIYETLKVTYLRYMNGQEEKRKSNDLLLPNVLVLWACGMVSGSIGATTVYPLNLVRTRLQAQGTPGHPHRYSSAWDAARKTFQADGVRGFYKGLGPTLFKVVPSVSISYAVYEFSKRSLGIS
ncbi:mitochondrial carrier domain-containing protein [Zychaea mexicana]|uniref:mitochondrial carrier domain-containing protein n=1 Tax=Zychaea mexicana TaxID=64656 RepID=UPI0022FE6ACA|nr:mitochondrial carrier domain-containing protein [Zychaea mexicana]KAI9491351.1 mitochondrial carrier domain-containing protein [Zychaea mexicana]